MDTESDPQLIISIPRLRKPKRGNTPYTPHHALERIAPTRAMRRKYPKAESNNHRIPHGVPLERPSRASIFAKHPAKSPVVTCAKSRSARSASGNPANELFGVQ